MNSKSQIQVGFIVSGINGYIGRNFCQSMLTSGHIVIGFDTNDNSDWVNSLTTEDKRRLHICIGTINDTNAKLQTLKHLASNWQAVNFLGIANVSTCENDPSLAYYTNVHLALEYAKLCIHFGCKGFVHISTGYVYGTNCAYEISEKQAVYPFNVYISTKLASENLLQAQLRNSEMTLWILRLSNVYSAQSKPDTVIGIILDQVKQKRPVEVRDYTPIRDFIHLNDVVSAIGQTYFSNKPNTTYLCNIGTGIGTSVRNIATRCATLAQVPIIENPNNIVKEETSILILKSDKFQKITGWKPKVEINQGLQSIITGDTNAET